MVFFWCRSWCDYKEKAIGDWERRKRTEPWEPPAFGGLVELRRGTGLSRRHGEPHELPGESGHPGAQGRTLCEWDATRKCLDKAGKVRPARLQELPRSGGWAATRPSLHLETAQGLSVHCPHTAGFVFLTILKGLYKQEICMPKISKDHKTSCQLTPGIRKRNRSLSVSRLGEMQARRKDLKPERTDQIFRKQKRKKYYVWFKTVLRQSANQTI